MKKTRYISWIWSFWKPQLHMLPILCLLTLFSTAVVVAWPLAWKYALDAVQGLSRHAGGEQMERISQALGILLLVGAGRSLRNLYPMLRARVNGVLEMAIRRVYFRRVLDKGHGFFMEFRTGDIVTRLTDDISGWLKIAWFLCSGIFRAFESAVGLLFCVAAMLLVDWRLGLVAIAPLPLMMLIWTRVRIALGRRFEENQRAISKTNDLLESCFSGIRIVKAYNAEERFRKRVGSLLAERIEVEMGVVRLWALLEGIYLGIVNLGRVLTIGVGGFWVLDGSLTLGSLYAIFLWVDQLVRPMMDLPQFFISGKQSAVCIDRLEEMSRFEKDFDEGFDDGSDGVGETRPLQRLDRIAFEQVSFRFGNSSGREALSNVSFDLPRGKKLAVMGPVGAGKSTLARILSGELRPSSGRLLVNGVPRSEFDPADYRDRLGYIPQEALLFSDTVRENIAFGRPFDEERIREALRVARMEEEVDRFPKGLGELLGQRGVRVSGGQRQRLAVARALAGDPDLLVMDDVTAALDAENEEGLWDALLARYPRLTAVIVTHRTATARRADSILVLDRGRTVDQGTHEELLERCEVYRRLAGRLSP